MARGGCRSGHAGARARSSESEARRSGLTSGRVKKCLTSEISKEGER